MRKLKMVVVDDDGDILTPLVSLLRALCSGCSVDPLHVVGMTPAGAGSWLIEQGIDVVVLDYHWGNAFPEGGLQVAEFLAEKGHTNTVVIMNSLVSPWDLKRRFEGSGLQGLQIHYLPRKSDGDAIAAIVAKK